MDTTVREGGCACGAVRYRVEGEPVFVNNCHCRLCQRQTGSSSVVNAFYETERLTLLDGELSNHPVPTGSGAQQIIRRCKACGVSLWSHYPRLGKLGLGLRVGTLDEPDTLRPDAGARHAVGCHAGRHSGVRNRLQPDGGPATGSYGPAQGPDRATQGRRGLMAQS